MKRSADPLLLKGSRMQAVIPRYTHPMKTAISVPDAVFARVDTRAAELGLNRSEFYTRAAEFYLRHLEENDITARMNEAIARSGDAAQQEAREWAEMSRRHLARYLESDEW